MNGKSPWLGIVLISAIGACLLVCIAGGLTIRYFDDIYTWANSRNSLKVGSSAPDFVLNTLDGQVAWLSQFRGQPVMLTFATSWCPACRSEASMIQSLHTRRPQLIVLLVDSNETIDEVRGFAREFRMTHPILLDSNGKVSSQYRIYAIPTTFFIAPDGTIRAINIGDMTPALLAANLPLIGAKP